jgi:phosphoribosyl 1,2-cyclic phosphodiesterase
MTTESHARLIITVVGTGAAFSPFGRNKTWPKANTSILVMVEHRGKIAFRALVDVGPSIPDALANELYAQVWPLNAVLISHTHFDHLGGLDRLVSDASRYARRQNPTRPETLGLYCLQSTYDDAIERQFPYLSRAITHVPLTPAKRTTLWRDVGAELNVTPIEVEHFKQSVVFVFEFADGAGGTAKVISLFDFNRFYEDDTKPGSSATNPLFMHPTLLVAPVNTWDDPEVRAARPTGHASFVTTVANLVAKWEPVRTWLVHYSGYEDAAGSGKMERYSELLHNDSAIHPDMGPTSEWELTAAAQEHMRTLRFLEPLSITAARPGDVTVVPTAERLCACTRDADGILRVAGPISPDIAHRFGVPHSTALVWPVRPDGRIVVHRRSPWKRTAPNALDACGGHHQFEPGMAGRSVASTIAETALREVNEEILMIPLHRFGPADVIQLGEAGAFTTGLDTPGRGNVEYSTLFIVQLPSDAVTIRDSDTKGTRTLESTAMTFDQLLLKYREQPAEFADGLGRVLDRILKDGELEMEIRRLLTI